MAAHTPWIKAESSRSQQLDFLCKTITTIVRDMRAYWPLTLRQIYYQLVGTDVIVNTAKSYGNLTGHLTKLREGGVVPWESMEDRHRVFKRYSGWPSKSAFVADEFDSFLEGFRLDTMATQPVRPEIWIEKDALYSIVSPIADEYHVDLVVSKGFTSADFRHKCEQRILQRQRCGQDTHILWFGDQDPSGREMLPSLLRKLGLPASGGTHVAITPEQIREYDLPNDPTAGKAGDSRFTNYVREYGRLFVEIDALATRDNLPTLQQLVRDSIEAQLDMDEFEAQREVETDCIDELTEEKNRLVDFLSYE